MKNVSKKSKLNLYRKEQLIILLLLLCFVVSGFTLPKMRTEVSAESSYIDETSPDESLEMVTEETQENASDTEIFPEEALENSPDEATASEDSSSASITTKPSGNTSGSSTGNSSSSANKQPVQDSPAKEPEKVWVPPVYQTIHHEAVYQTVRIVVCNYCGATFSTVGEFQVHKDANGG